MVLGIVLTGVVLGVIGIVTGSWLVSPSPSRSLYALFVLAADRVGADRSAGCGIRPLVPSRAAVHTLRVGHRLCAGLPQAHPQHHDAHWTVT
jgi:hypothetical protein